MRKFLFMLFFWPSITGTTQGVVNVNNVAPGTISTSIRNAFTYLSGGYPVPSTKYVQVVSGSPYFQDSLMKAKLVLSGGRVIDSLLIRLDLVENLVQYISADGTEMVATTPMRGISLFDTISGKQYDFVYSEYMPVQPEEPGWYQVLGYGNVMLYKRIAKKLTESKPYGSSLTEQTIHTTDQYFILSGGIYTRVKKLKELPDLLAGKRNELNALISNKRLSGKSDQDFIDVVSEYNTLIQQ